MLELGLQAEKQHRNIGILLNKSKIDVILTYGKFAFFTSNEITNKIIYKKHFYSISNLEKNLKKIIRTNDLIYLKGSRMMELEKLYNKAEAKNFAYSWSINSWGIWE